MKKGNRKLKVGGWKVGGEWRRRRGRKGNEGGM